MLVIIVFLTFAVTFIIALVLELVLKYTSKKYNTNPQFLDFQQSYFIVYYLLVFGDWLNAPYLYKLYTTYGFLEEQIAIIYVCGFASSLIVSPLSGHIALKYGLRFVFTVSAVVYALASLMKLSSDYSTLIIARILFGVATSLLFTSQKLWYIEQHTERYDFPSEWLDYTADKAAKGNSAFAVGAGLLAYVMSEVYDLGPAAPSVLSAFALSMAAIFAFVTWNERAETEQQNLLPRTLKKQTEKKLFKIICPGLRTIVQDQKHLRFGLIQALYESVMCMFVFLWTPVLDHHQPPLGVVFASFMAGSLASAALYRISTTAFPALSTTLSLLIILCSAAASVLFCVISTEPSREFPVISFVAFFLFEAISGMYFPVMRDVKRDVGLDKADSTLTTWFRFPLNFLACSGLLFLHSSSNLTGTRNLFACCVALIAFAAALSVSFVTHKPKQFDSAHEDA